jgi:hypothetical protein
VVSTQKGICLAFFLPNAMIPVYGRNTIHSRCFGDFIHGLLWHTYRSTNGPLPV